MTALRLYLHYLELKADEDKSTWVTTLQRIYEEGRKDGFQVPEA
jgi:hypothetical protein